MPYAWFLSLARPDRRDHFVSNELSRSGYLPDSYDGESTIAAGAVLAPIDRAPDLFLVRAGQTAIVDRLLTRGASMVAAENILLNDVSPAGGKGLGAEYFDQRTDPDLRAYRARPLDGIWATAPFLHNGSVPNLCELLLPAERWSKPFRVGSRELDADRIGLRPDIGPFLFDTTRPDDADRGHEGAICGTEQLDNGQRRQLLEYLRTL